VRDHQEPDHLGFGRLWRRHLRGSPWNFILLGVALALASQR
jgi:hypothetical protein